MIFTYCGNIDADLTRINGANVTVLRPLMNDYGAGELEGDEQEVGMMFLCRTEDGFRFNAYADELTV